MTMQPWQPNEVATYQQPAPVPDYQSRAVSRLSDWAQAADAAYTVATRLVQSSFVPTGFRGKPVEATAAILAGSEVGLSPMASLRSFDIIQGQAAPRALTLRAIAQSYGHDIEVVETNNSRCRVRARRRGGEWQTITWTIDRAKELKLTGKENWRTQPAAMLIARATSEAARLVAADAILGIGYSAEEIADGTSAEATSAAQTVDSTPTTTRRMSRPTPTPEPEPEEPDTEAPEPSITAAQLKALHTLLGKAEMDRDAAIAWFCQRTDRDITSSKDLTKREASELIDALSAATTEADTLPVGGEDRG